jgi:glycosyltransferase involved in cell wall biosynthesis
VLHVFGGAVRSGVESVVLDQADGLRRRGGEPLLVPLAEGTFSEEARDLGFTVLPLEKRRRYDLFSIPRLAALIRDSRPDIVHSHAVNGAFYACPAALLAGVRHQVSTFHGDTREHLRDVYRNPLPRLLAHRYYLLLARRCQRLIAVSEALRRDLIRDGVPAGKIVCIPNGIDVEAYRGAAGARASVRAGLGVGPRTRLIGTICRLAPVKNLPMLLRAAELLLRSDGELRFVIAGEGPERGSLEKMAADLGIADRVQFTGWRDDVPELLSALDIFAMTSRSEICPVVAQGAMALGVPIVSTAVGFIPEVEHLEAWGLVVPRDGADAMARAISSLLADDALAHRAGEVGRAFVERHFAREHVLDDLMNLYADLTAQAAG